MKILFFCKRKIFDMSHFGTVPKCTRHLVLYHLYKTLLIDLVLLLFAAHQILFLFYLVLVLFLLLLIWAYILVLHLLLFHFLFHLLIEGLYFLLLLLLCTVRFLLRTITSFFSLLKPNTNSGTLYAIPKPFL